MGGRLLGSGMEREPAAEPGLRTLGSGRRGRTVLRMDELVVGYRNGGELRKKLRVKHAMLGALCLLPRIAFCGCLLRALPELDLPAGGAAGDRDRRRSARGARRTDDGRPVHPGYGQGRSPPTALPGCCAATGSWSTPPRGPVHTPPWSQVRISAATVAGQPAVSVGGPQATTTYAAEYLTHNQQQLDAAARQLSQPIWS